MKSYGQLWNKIVSEENLREGWRLFLRHHSTKIPVKRYNAKIDEHLRTIQGQLTDGTWRPGEYHQFMVYEPKPRMISCVALPDRVVHHAFCNICAPLMERRFIRQSYACRKGKGSHMAVTRARELCGRYRYYLKLDIRHYFASIDHDILLRIIARTIGDRDVLRLVRVLVKECDCIRNGRGLPLGALLRPRRRLCLTP